MTVSKSFWFKDWPEEGKKGQRGNFSNDKQDTFRPEKGYVGVRLQQGVPLLDRDWNELEDIRRYQEMMLRKHYLGNGTPDDGFKISAFNPPKNDFKISTGRILLDGHEAVNELGRLDYKASYDKELTRPMSGSRMDTVYLDAWIEEVLESDEAALGNDQDVDMETCIRHRLRWKIIVDEGSDGISNEEGHHYYKLAEITRKSDTLPVAEADIKDLRSYWQPLDEVQKTMDEFRRSMDDMSKTFRSRINSFLRGNLPSDPKIDLASDIRDSSFNSKVLKDSKGHTWFIWAYDRFSNLKCRVNISGNWSREIRITSEGLEKHILETFVERDGKIWIFWLQKKVSSGPLDLYCREINSENLTMSKIAPITSNVDDIAFKTSFCDSNGNIWVFWTEKRSGLYELMAKNYKEKLGWSTINVELRANQPDDIEKPFCDSNGVIWIFLRQMRDEKTIISVQRYGQDWDLIDSDSIQSGNISGIAHILEIKNGDIQLFCWQRTSMEPIASSQLLLKTSKNWDKSDTVIPTPYISPIPVKVIASPSGDMWAFWLHNGNIFYNRYVSRLKEWVNGNEPLAEGAEELPDVLPCSNGDLFLIWKKMNSDNIIYLFNIFDFVSEKWSGNSRFPLEPKKVFETSLGDIWELYQKPSFSNIWCRRYVDGDWLEEIRLVGSATEKNLIDCIEDQAGSYWIIWKEPIKSEIFKAHCMKIYDQI